MSPRDLWPFSKALGLTSPPLRALWGLEKGSPQSIGNRAKGAQSYCWAMRDTAIGGLSADSKDMAQDQLPRGREALLFPQQELSCYSFMKCCSKASGQESLRAVLQDTPLGPAWPGSPESSGFGSAPKPSPEEREREKAQFTHSCYTLYLGLYLYSQNLNNKE